MDYLTKCRPGPVQQFLQSWSDFHVNPVSYPLSLEAAYKHADAFTNAAAAEGISQRQIEEAICGVKLRDLMLLRMRHAVESQISANSVVRADPADMEPLRRQERVPVS